LLSRGEIVFDCLLAGLRSSASSCEKNFGRWRRDRDSIADLLLSEPRVIIVKSELEETRDAPNEKFASDWSNVGINASRFLSESKVGSEE
jgi:hypothetical protein